MIHRVTVDDGGIRVAVLPTFIGCPALDLIRASIATSLAAFDRPVEVETTFETPGPPTGSARPAAERWPRPGSRRHRTADVRCPWCASAQVVMDSAFGPTQCRSLYYCRACRQPFEALKSV